MRTPVWNTFLDRITGGNADLILFLRRMAGYSLTGSTEEHALFFLYGLGANSKSTFLNAITAAAVNYHCTTPIETFTASHHDLHLTELAALARGKACHSYGNRRGPPMGREPDQGTHGWRKDWGPIYAAGLL